METIITSKIILTPLIPLITALLIMGSKNKPNLRETWSVCGAVLTFLSVVYFLPRLLARGSYEYTMFTLYPGVSVKFHLDGLGYYFRRDLFIFMDHGGILLHGIHARIGRTRPDEILLLLCRCGGRCHGSGIFRQSVYPLSVLRNRLHIYLSSGGTPPG